jgi:hypothetical protein
MVHASFWFTLMVIILSSTVKKSMYVLLVTSKETGGEVNAVGTKLMFVFHKHNARQNHNICN